GIPEVDRVLAGSGVVSATAVRDTEGTRLESLAIQTDAASLQASADLTSDGADARIDARLGDLALVLNDLSGPAEVSGDLVQGAGGLLDFALRGTGPALAFNATGTMRPDPVGQTITANLTADFRDLTRYGALAGQPLAGAVTVAANGNLQTSSFRFDGQISGTTQDLVTGIARIDPVLGGNGTFSGSFARPDGDRFQVSDLRVQTPGMSLQGNAGLNLAGSNQADITFRITDAALLDPSLSGPVTLTVNATPAADDATDTVLRLVGPGTEIVLDAVVASPSNDYEVTGDLTAQIARLASYASLIGQPVAGSIDLTASGSVLPDLTRFDSQVSLRSENLAIGNATLDPLLAGTGRINATVGLADGVLAVRTLEVSTREVSIVGALNGAAGFGQGRFNASLRDVGVLTDQISGPVRATGSASLDENGTWGIDANGTGPGGLAASIAGDLRQDGNLSINVDGSAPLALA
ncbi:MAG: hypothetical protein NWR52_02765, partial [Paracoccaceae bacterium]|nr:hypothetical protein [Paracoccaceae bacterium]